MRCLLHSIVAASNEAVAIDNALTASRAREVELEGCMHKLQLRAAHMTFDAGKSCTSAPVPREHEHETDEEMAIKVLAARATAQNEKAKRKALERKMRACSRELDSRKRFTPKRAPSRGESSQILSPNGSQCEEHSPSSQPGQQLSHARYRSGWKPNVTKVLEAQSGVAGRRLNPKLLWHIEVREKQTDTDPDTDLDKGTDTGTDTHIAALPKEEEELLGMSGKHVTVLRCEKKARQQHDAHVMQLARAWVVADVGLVSTAAPALSHSVAVAKCSRRSYQQVRKIHKSQRPASLLELMSFGPLDQFETPPVGRFAGYQRNSERACSPGSTRRDAGPWNGLAGAKP
jgi:hypothetical protein